MKTASVLQMEIQREPARRSPVRRALVLTDDAARHGFRATLPLHVRQPLPPQLAERWWISKRDWRQFFATYAAGFVVVSAFFA